MEDRDTRRPGRPRKAPDEQKKKYARVSPVDRCRIIDVHRRGGDLKVLSETLGINIKTVRSIALLTVTQLKHVVVRRRSLDRTWWTPCNKSYRKIHPSRWNK
ncbi:hypothetical protein HPB52_013284 [Rhipicephalus sanguineus]|uniref:Uncharacterized protein n=1 Tax=Rhipicephalus sanguineus TaxID=34632 RepID=A0A9D4Q6S6_RHISA|nr:hypothetical protein HPB52_013284 [Rhipicephalus sanguineus]